MQSWRILTGLVSATLFSVGFLDAQPRVSSDTQEFDGSTGEAVFRGSVVLLDDGLRIEADELRYNRSAGTVQASGDMVLTTPEYRLLSDDLTYTIASGGLQSGAFRFGAWPVYAEGKRFAGTRDHIEIEEATLFYGEPDRWSPRLSAGQIELAPGRRISVRGPRFQAGPIPLFWVPGGAFPWELPPLRFSGDLGYGDNLGAYFRSDILVPAGGGWSIGGALDGYSRRGLLAGPAVAFDDIRSDGFIASHLRTGFLRDSGNRGVDFRDNPVPAHRGFLEWRHLQRHGGGYTRAKLSRWSDSEVLRDFRPDDFDLDPQPDSYVEAGWRTGLWRFSAFARIDLNDQPRIRERLPEIRVDLVPNRPAALPFVHALAASFVRLAEDDLFTGVERETDRLDLVYEAHETIRLTPAASFVPVAGFRVTRYSDAIDGEAFTRTIGEVGFDLRAHAHADWTFDRPFWGLSGLRHVVSPLLQYRHFPNADSGNDRIIPIDRELFSVAPGSLDLASLRTIDTLDDHQRVRIGFENRLLSRDTEGATRAWLHWDLYQDIIVDPEPGEDAWGSLTSRLVAHPAEWLEFDLAKRIHTETLSFEEYRLQLTLRDGQFGEYSAATYFVRNRIEQYRLEIHRVLNPRFSVRARWWYDARTRQFTEQVYGLRQRLGNAWAVEYQLAFREGSRREDEVRFNIRLDLLTF